MALASRLFPDKTLIHHSDRGVQYCSGNYIEMLVNNNIAISMTQNGSPYENALAERMNGVIKSEFFPKRCFQNHIEAKKAIDNIIVTYNQLRPHSSLNYLTPDAAYEQTGHIKKRWKNYPKRKLIVPIET